MSRVTLSLRGWMLTCEDMRNACFLRMMPCLAALVVFSLGLGSCGLLDNDALEYEIMEDVPYLASGFVISGDESGESQAARFDGVCTIINGIEDVHKLFSEEDLAECPAIAGVNYSRYSVVVYTCYLGGMSMGYVIDGWGHDESDGGYKLSLRLGMGAGIEGWRYLHQVAFRTKKIDGNAIITVDRHFD